MREEQRLGVFENGLLRKPCGHKRDEVMREWRRLYNEELYDLYASTKIVRVPNSSRLRWAHNTHGGQERFWWRNMRKETTWKADGRMITKWTFKWDGKAQTGFI
jgi:hypothetical protein